MDVLLLITLACFFALFVTALAIARHIRIVEGRPSHVPQDRPPPHPPVREVSHPVARRATDQSLHQLVEHKEPDWRYITSGERRSLFPGKMVSQAMRKPPESARLHLRDLPGSAKSNQVRADLSDPYTRPSSKELRPAAR